MRPSDLTSRSLTRWLLLACAAFVLPLSASGGGVRGVSELLESLLCGCRHAEHEAQPSSCCASEQEQAPPAAPGDCGEAGGGCCCSTPDEGPGHDGQPLADERTAGQDEEAGARLRAAQDAAALTPCASTAGRAALTLVDPTAPPDADRSRPSGVAGTTGTRERLALLCTARL